MHYFKMAATAESNIRLGKKKKVSKKSKRSWRKHTDIKDVEEHLEEVRREERTGGPVAEKPDANLFFVDTKTKETTEDPSKPKRSRKRKLLKCDQLLLPDNRIKTVLGKKRKLGKNAKNAKQTTRDSDSSSEEEEMDSKPLIKEQSGKEKQKGKAAFDLWATEEKSTDDDHYLKVTCKKKIKVPKTAKRQVTELPAVDLCHPGASYNPTFDDHQDLLGIANEVEVLKKKKNEKLDRKVRFLTKEEAAALPTWEEEMGEGLFDDDDDEKDDDDDSDDDDDDEKSDDDEDDEEDLAGASVSTNKMKSKQKKRKEMEEKEKQKDLDAEKDLKLKENDIFRIKTLKKEISAAELEAEKRKEIKDERDKSRLQRTRKLGKYSYLKPEVEIQLSEEVTGTLRTLKQEGNLFKDRFRNLQKRNIIEPRVPVIPHRKYAKKEYERRSYKKPTINELGDIKSSKKKR